MHRYLCEHRILAKMQAAFEVLPTPAMLPADAYREVVRGNVESLRISDMRGRIAAVMIVPYPPGIPVMMGGETMDQSAEPILEYLCGREAFENEFPGYAGDIHGITREADGGNVRFRTLAIKR